MSYKLPIVSTPVGGIPEIIEDGKNGFLVSPGDKKELYNVLRKLVDNDKLRYMMGNFSYEKVAPHLPDAISHNLQTIYQNIFDALADLDFFCQYFCLHPNIYL